MHQKFSVSVLGAALALAMTGCSRPHDVAWYKAHPKEQQAMSKQCGTGFAKSQTEDCHNADRAGMEKAFDPNNMAIPAFSIPPSQMPFGPPKKH